MNHFVDHSRKGCMSVRTIVCCGSRTHCFRFMGSVYFTCALVTKGMLTKDNYFRLRRNIQRLTSGNTTPSSLLLHMRCSHWLFGCFFCTVSDIFGSEVVQWISVREMLTQTCPARLAVNVVARALLSVATNCRRWRNFRRSNHLACVRRAKQMMTNTTKQIYQSIIFLFRTLGTCHLQNTVSINIQHLTQKSKKVKRKIVR